MRALDVLTKLVIGMGRFGDHLLSRRFSGAAVAALAFACGACLVYALTPAPGAKTAAAPAVSTPPCETAAPHAEVAVPFFDDEDWNTPELEDWKNRHSGAPLPIDYDLAAPTFRLAEAKVIVLPSGGTLALAGNLLYMFDADRRVVWKYGVSQWANDFAYVGATGLVYVTAGDNNFFILDASDGRELLHESRNGSAGFGAVLPYGEDACLVMDEFSGYRAGFREVGASALPMQDGVTAWRGTRVLWRRDVPPDAELQVVGSKIFAVTKTRTRILVKEIKAPKGKR